MTINPGQTGNFDLFWMPSDSVGGVASGHSVIDSPLPPAFFKLSNDWR